MAVLRLVWAKVKVRDPADAVVGVVRANTGVLAVREVVVEMRTWLLGVVRVTLKTSPLVDAGITTTKDVGLE